MYWLAILRQANRGNKEAEEMLRQTDEARAEAGQPSVREELKAIVDEARTRKEIEDYKSSVMREFKKHM